MKKLFIALFITASFFSCKKDSNSDDTAFSIKLQKKWILPAANSLNYKWIEFTKGNSYIILQNDNSSKTNKYSISSDNKTITLVNIGTLSITSLITDVLDFSITKTGSTSATSLRGSSGVVLGSSTNTSLICQDWNLYKSYDYKGVSNTYDTVLYPQTNQNSTGITKVNATFTNYGTYFVTRVDKTTTGFDTTYLNANWNWDNPTETRLAYSYTSSGNPISGKVSILQLTTQDFKLEEDSSKYFLSR